MGSSTKGSAPGTPMPRLEAGVGWIVGFGLFWLAKRAAKRKDWHEYNHIMSMLVVGNSEHRKVPCPFPPEFNTRPIKMQGAVFMPADQAPPAAGGGQ